MVVFSPRFREDEVSARQLGRALSERDLTRWRLEQCALCAGQTRLAEMMSLHPERRDAQVYPNMRAIHFLCSAFRSPHFLWGRDIGRECRLASRAQQIVDRTALRSSIDIWLVHE